VQKVHFNRIRLIQNCELIEFHSSAFGFGEKYKLSSKCRFIHKRKYSIYYFFYFSKVEIPFFSGTLFEPSICLYRNVSEVDSSEFCLLSLNLEFYLQNVLFFLMIEENIENFILLLSLSLFLFGDCQYRLLT